MFDSVQSAFRAFNEQFEGSIPFMYLDIKGLVTVAVGNLIDPVEYAQALPFRFKNKPGIVAPGSPATKDQIAAEWQSLKNNTNLARLGHKACEPLTQLELDEDSMNQLIAQKLASNADFLKRQVWFQAFDTWPADAQLGILSMTWAMGPGGPGGFPHFRAACQSLKFDVAATECKMDETGNPGVVPRNRANVVLFSNAAVVLAGEPQSTFQRSTLYYPKALNAAAGA